MFGLDMMTSTFGNPSITMSPSSSATKSQSESPMSPATPQGKLQSPTSDGYGSKCKRKINFTHLGIPPKGHQPATVARRNARERNRVKQVNNGFQALKQHIPLGHRSKKMSKVETLRCAVEYIKNLKGMLNHMDGSSSQSSHESAYDQLQNYEMGSVGSSSYNQMSPASSDDPQSPSYASDYGSYVHTSTALPYDCENYEPVSPEDEELLDAISFWQQN